MIPPPQPPNRCAWPGVKCPRLPQPETVRLVSSRGAGTNRGGRVGKRTFLPGLWVVNGAEALRGAHTNGELGMNGKRDKEISFTKDMLPLTHTLYQNVTGVRVEMDKRCKRAE